MHHASSHTHYRVVHNQSHPDLIPPLIRFTCRAAVSSMEPKHSGLPKNTLGWKVDILMKRVVIT